MLPIFFFAVRWGLKDGLLCSFVFGILQLLLDGGFAIGWQSMLGDYILAFGVLGLAGLCAGKKWGVFAGTVIGSVARFLVHWVVGATIWAEYMPDEFFGMTMTSPWFYSALYNGSYMVIDMAACLGGVRRPVRAHEEILFGTGPAKIKRAEEHKKQKKVRFRNGNAFF